VISNRRDRRTLVLYLPAVGDNAAMEEEAPKSDPPKRKRRWFQFSLRTLMIFVVIVAIPCAWLGRKIAQKRREREAVASVVKLGGRVFFDYQRDETGSRPAGPPGGTKTSASWREKADPAGPAWLRSFLGDDFFSEVGGVWADSSAFTDAHLDGIGHFLYLQDLSLQGSRVTDAGLANVESLRRLKHLYLDNTRIGDDGLAHLSGLSLLERLSLHGTGITDAGLAHLRASTRLRALLLAETRITDSGLVYLRNLSQLETLILWGTDVTDAGLIHLEGLSNLKLIEVTDTRTTRAGVKKLQAILPNCQILR
jgi:Leucine Rich repeat